VIPTATYRLQLTGDFGFDDAARVVRYLRRLGVSHVYTSPILRAAPGSTHGYDVVDHTSVSDELGGADGFGRLVAALRAHGMGAVVDVVPNHMGMPVPEWRNRPLWSVLRDGPESPYAAWFDIDWDAQDGTLLLPVLGRRVGACLRDGEFRVDTQSPVDTEGPEPVLRYYDHVFPIRPGTEHLIPSLPDLLAAQHYRLAYWRVATEEPGYRRFFDITTLVAVRVEDPDVFAGSHRLLLDLVAAGDIDGLRIDHPDGLADPRGYLRRLHEATDGCWIVVEKILEGAERLPADWPCAGTTGYDALRAVTGLLLDPDGLARLVALHTAITGLPADFAAITAAAKRHVLDRVLTAEVDRLAVLAAAICRQDIALHDHTTVGLREAIAALLTAIPVYRAYAVPGEPPSAETVTVIDAALAAAREELPEERHETVDLVSALALGRLGRSPARDEFLVRFQQTCGPVMAKGLEDTAFYQWAPLAACNEVGGDPAHPVISPAAFHESCAVLARDWPATMTTLSTHDTKRSEDARARLLVLAELPQEWMHAVASWQAAARPYRKSEDRPDAATEYVLWQTLVAAWPLDEPRLLEFLRKATREAKLHTSWTDPDTAYEEAVAAFGRAVLADAGLSAGIADFVAGLDADATVNTLSQKLLQLTMPGVPDVYQGCETRMFALVDPDNRRPADFAARAALLDRLDADPTTGFDDPDAAKLLVTSRALRLRRERPDCFGPGGEYTPLPASGPAADHAVAFLRGEDAVTVATRLPVGLRRLGGWDRSGLTLPPGPWADVLTGRAVDGGPVRLADLLSRLPVALLTRS
jgi:(1->4)-alpha-D-glucan 1-alpha-D-glucosylmutase